MDLIEGLAKQASQLTMYDVKSYYNQAKNVVFNVSETEAKVREATNDDPWGASSTLMQQIADGTHNFAQFNEIMPTIYSRFMEKEAREWRQIYKALTLLEFLVKNGSERVVDDARAHVSTIKMLRSFHYIDEKGKDQGINVRNRASEIAALLGDVEKIRTERRKAKANKNKYQGVSSEGAMSFATAGGSRYGGFGSESLGGGGGGGGGGSGGSSRYGGSNDNGDDYRSSSRGFRDTAAKAVEYDEYEGADDFEGDQPPRRTAAASTSRSARTSAPPKPVAKESKPVEKPKEVNLFDFGDDDVLSAPAPAPAAAATLGGDDDFDDFQQAPSASSPPPAFAPAKPANANANLFDLLGATSSSAAPAIGQAPRAPSLSGTAFSIPTPNYTSPPPLAKPTLNASRPSYSAATPPASSSKPTGGSTSTFDDLFTTSLSSIGGKATTPSGQQGKSIKDLANEKAVNSIWGSTSKPSQPQAPAKPSGGGGDFDDLLL